MKPSTKIAICVATAIVFDAAAFLYLKHVEKQDEKRMRKTHRARLDEYFDKKPEVVDMFFDDMMQGFINE